MKKRFFLLAFSLFSFYLSVNAQWINEETDLLPLSQNIEQDKSA